MNQPLVTCCVEQLTTLDRRGQLLIFVHRLKKSESERNEGSGESNNQSVVELGDVKNGQQPIYGPLYLGQRFIYINIYAFSFQKTFDSRTSSPPKNTAPSPSSHRSLSLPASSPALAKELSAPPPSSSKLRLLGSPVCPAPDVTVRLQRLAGFWLPIGPSPTACAAHQWQRRWVGGCPHPRWRPRELGAGDRQRGSGLSWPCDCGVLGAFPWVTP